MSAVPQNTNIYPSGTALKQNIGMPNIPPASQVPVTPGTSPATQQNQTGQINDLNTFYQSHGAQLPSVQDRVNDPMFVQALQAAGMTPQQYLALGANNEQANQAILPHLIQLSQAGNKPANATATPAATPTQAPTSTATPSPAPNTPASTGDPYLDSINAQKTQYLQQQNDAYNSLQTTLASLSSGPLKLAPEEQQYIDAMTASAASAKRIAQQAADAQTGMTRYNLAKTGQTQTSPAVAASQIALTVQAGANAIQDIDTKANLAISQFEQGIRANDVASARAAYTDFETAQKDRMDTLESMYKDVSDHEKDVRDYQLEQQKNQLEIEKFQHTLDVDASSSVNNLTPEGLDMLARGYITSGVLPSLGYGKNAVALRTAVINRSVELAGGNGNVDPALNKASYQANSASLKQQTQLLNTAQTAYNVFDKNGQFAVQLIQGLNKSNSPAINQLTNSVINQTTGQGQLDSFRAVITSLQAEYATLINVKGGGSGVITDSDKAKAQSAIPDNISPKRLQEVLNNLKTEGSNVLNQRQAEVNVIKGNISSSATTYNSQTSGTQETLQQFYSSSSPDVQNQINSLMQSNPSLSDDDIMQIIQGQ